MGIFLENGKPFRYSTIRDVWDIDPLFNATKERLGYGTQKPIKLLNRIIESSCPENGIVLDPFCGCGTAIESAIINSRNWIGIDISNNATDIIKQRIENIELVTELKKI